MINLETNLLAGLTEAAEFQFAVASQHRRGTARWEVLILVVVLLTVVGLLAPSVQRVRESAARTATENNLHQCCNCALLCSDQFGKLPPYFGIYGPKTIPFTFHVHLLAFLDSSPLYADPVPTAVVGTYLSTMDRTWTNNGANACNFPVNIRLFHLQGGTGALSSADDKNLIYPKMPDTFPDGASCTLMFSTKYMNCGNGGSLWPDPGNNGPNSLTAATFGKSMDSSASSTFTGKLRSQHRDRTELHSSIHSGRYV